MNEENYEEEFQYDVDIDTNDVSEVGDRFVFSIEQFAPSIVPNLNDSVPDTAQRALSFSIFTFWK